jgi:hypothetical protein
MGSLETLRTVMKVQSVIFIAYGAAFLLFPDFTLGTLFGYEVDSLWPRAIGAAFLGVAWLEWGITVRLERRVDLVWPFALIPGLILVVFLWERAAGTYPGSDSFFWVSIVVTLVFFVAVIAARPREAPEPIT